MSGMRSDIRRASRRDAAGQAVPAAGAGAAGTVHPAAASLRSRFIAVRPKRGWRAVVMHNVFTPLHSAYFCSRCFSSLRTPFPAGRSLAAAPRPRASFPLLFTFLAAALLLVAGFLNIVGALICVLAPPAHVARGLAIATLLLTLIAFEQLLSASSRLFFLMDEMPGRFGGFGPQFWIGGAIILWVVDIARLCVLAAFCAR